MGLWVLVIFLNTIGEHVIKKVKNSEKTNIPIFPHSTIAIRGNAIIPWETL